MSKNEFILTLSTEQINMLALLKTLIEHSMKKDRNRMIMLLVQEMKDEHDHQYGAFKNGLKFAIELLEKEECQC